MEKWSFHNLNQFHDKWFIIFDREYDCQITLFPELSKMSKYIAVKYYAENEFTKESCQATGDSAGYDVFAAETKTFLPKSVDIFLLELRWAIPTGFYGKLFHKVSDQHLLGKTKRGNDGFGSTGITVIKKFKKDNDNDENDENDDKTTSENQQVIVDSEDNQVTFEETIMTVNNKVVVHESITIDE